MVYVFYFFFNDTATTEIYTLSLHDPLPIYLRIVPAFAGWDDPGAAFTAVTQLGTMAAVLLYFRADLWAIATGFVRSEEHTSELQSRQYLACRLLLEKKINKIILTNPTPISI